MASCHSSHGLLGTAVECLPGRDPLVDEKKPNWEQVTDYFRKGFKSGQRRRKDSLACDDRMGTSAARRETRSGNNFTKWEN